VGGREEEERSREECKEQEEEVEQINDGSSSIPQGKWKVCYIC
jgi:hypothetical protein